MVEVLFRLCGRFLIRVEYETDGEREWQKMMMQT